ncbi:gamma-glutamylcyclotransferase [Halorubrum sp. CBA1125]|uniref:gamma-glutamylcyclotransferase family protein n=1 Tax=Halorubrum sp. CBA1125 TaxID=2668072 RepID=UPI0012E71384|nr:gamma-glutamylcyclotransferase family protein [Halorubrum sp. CBA1125]MUW15795.1 gamma-glutamylcyclotransferase [Halorubrum sp. CBA1125]
MDVFVYGTLTEPERVAEVCDSFVFVGPATLTGLRLVEGRYPTLAPGGETGGRLLRTDEIAALDAYEGVDDGLYYRVTVPLDAPAGHPAEAAVYVGDPDRLDADATWPDPGGSAEPGSDETAPFDRRVDAYLDATDVRVQLTGADPV